MPLRTTLPALALLLAAIPAAAQQRQPADPGRTITIPPYAAGQASDKPGTALAAAFGEFCLGRFPAQADLAQGALPPGARLTPMPAEQVRSFLKSDPGRGWIYQAPEGTYAVTVEDPPYKACAVRRMYPALPSYALSYQMLARTWSASQGRQFTDGETLQQARGGMVIKARTMNLPAARGQPAEVFMEFETQYPDRVEVRLVRQIPDPSVMRTR